MTQLEDLISRLESHIPDHERSDTTISKGSVGWHIEHSLLTMNAVIGALGKSDPKAYRSTFNIKRSVVMLLGKIPRGKVNAPKVVQPTIDFNAATLQQHINLTKEKLGILAGLSPDHFFTHPFLGDFKLKPSIRFLGVHTKHHLAIIEDIVKRSK
jgi:hypothetical protein